MRKPAAGGASMTGLPSAWQLCAIGATLGAIFGSFLGAVLVRSASGRSIVAAPSTCDSCGHRLTVTELVPILSFIAQRGRCRTCGAPIDRWQLACEVGGAIVGAASWVGATPGALQGTAAMLLGWGLLLLALLDLRYMWLPRRFVATLAGIGVVFALIRSRDAGWDGEPLVIAALGGATGFAMLWVVRMLYARGRGREGMGAGDPPLLGAIGIWLGPVGVIGVVLGGSLIGIAAAAAMHLTGRRVTADTVLPLGTCLAAAAWPLFLLQGFG